MTFGKAAIALLLVAAPALAQTAPPIRPPAEIGTAYGRLGRAMQAHDAAGVKSVWADDFVVNAPNNEVLSRDQVIAAMADDLLAYRDFAKHISFVGVKPEMTVVMGYDTMVPLKGPGAGRRVTRPFTDVWAKRDGSWLLVARQATIAAVE